jgi:hypothetical protein
MQASMIHSDEQQGSITTKKTLFDFKLSQWTVKSATFEDIIICSLEKVNSHFFKVKG